ncbi:unnamed protein product [Caenorhabditis angaria]|uniref:Golgin-84 n=1 Tax=Caenorhabditis angaria TaxID=860376 RepID=A0A9P1IQH6_9PELO|nr:unnamed protein product [Caenorhabditis angaria]
MVSSKNNEIAAITKSLADEKQKCSELQAHILAIDTLKAEKVQTLQNDLKSLSKKFSLAETEALNLKEDLEIIKRTTAENTSAKNSELEAQLAKLAESKDKEISDFESKIADLTKKLEELPYERERANKLESRIEVIQQSFGHRQRRSEEELSATKQKLEDALKSLIEAKKDNIKIAEFKKRIDNLTSTSIEEKNKILADLEKVKNDLASSEESREADAELVTKLQANLVEDRICFEEEKNHLASALESTQQKLTAADEAKAADAQMIAQLENTVKALELALKTEKQDFLAENVEEVVERVDVPALAATNSGNVVNEEDLDFSSLLSSAHSYHRQLSHRLELLRQNQSIAFYPYIRYLFALYILLLHIWLLW